MVAPRTNYPLIPLKTTNLEYDPRCNKKYMPLEPLVNLGELTFFGVIW